MTIAASTIIFGAVTELGDAASVRWAVDEHVVALNDGQREIAANRPDAMVVDGAIPLTAGTRQTLPSGWIKLLDIQRNTGGTKKTVRQVNRKLLDEQYPGWHAMTGVDEIAHFMYDPRDPTVFYNYPPIATTGSVEGTGSKLPTDISKPGASKIWSDVTGNISVPDIFANALREYILFRAFSQDEEYAADPQRAKDKLVAFANALGIELKALLMVTPGSAAAQAVTE